MDTKAMASRIEQAIKDAGFSYQELANKTNLSKSSLQRYASGVTTKVPVEAVEKIADACGVSAEYLFGWDAPEEWFEAKKMNEQIVQTVVHMQGEPRYLEFCLEGQKLSGEARKRVLAFEPILAEQTEEQYKRMLELSPMLSKLSDEQYEYVRGLLTMILQK